MDIKQSVRGKHVFILQSGSKNVNNDIVELLILIYACKTSAATKVYSGILIGKGYDLIFEAYYV